MAKQSDSQPAKKRTGKSKSNGGGRKFREAFVAILDTPSCVSDATGDFEKTLILAPGKVTGVSIGTSTADFTEYVQQVAILNRFENLALSWFQYRILSATLIFTPSGGANSSGLLTINSTPQGQWGVINVNFPAANQKVVPVSGTGEKRIPLLVDTTWKISDGKTVAMSTRNMVMLCSLDACASGAFQITGTGLPVSSGFGRFELEYQVETRMPCS
jgi:hypothetical protein